MEKLISIIIPTFNRDSLIKQSISSILSQTYTNFEVIVVDDCSTDNTEQVVKSIHDERIKYVKLQEKSGAGIARNCGLKIAKGEIVAFEDSDDIWENNKLLIQINEMEREQARASFCQYIKYDYETNRMIEHIPSASFNKKYASFEELMLANFIGTPCLMGYREDFLEIEFDEHLPRFQDWDFVLRLAQRNKILYINKPLVKAYVQKDSITRNPEWGIIALETIYNKNLNYLKRNPKAESQIHLRLGDFYFEAKKSPVDEYKKALMLDFSIRKLEKYITAKLNILHHFYGK